MATKTKRTKFQFPCEMTKDGSNKRTVSFQLFIQDLLYTPITLLDDINAFL